MPRACTLPYCPPSFLCEAALLTPLSSRDFSFFLSLWWRGELRCLGPGPPGSASCPTSSRGCCSLTTAGLPANAKHAPELCLVVCSGPPAPGSPRLWPPVVPSGCEGSVPSSSPPAHAYCDHRAAFYFGPFWWTFAPHLLPPCSSSVSAEPGRRGAAAEPGGPLRGCVHSPLSDCPLSGGPGEGSAGGSGAWACSVSGGGRGAGAGGRGRAAAVFSHSFPRSSYLLSVWLW